MQPGGIKSGVLLNPRLRRVYGFFVIDLLIQPWLIKGMAAADRENCRSAQNCARTLTDLDTILDLDPGIGLARTRSAEEAQRRGSKIGSNV